MAPVVDTFAREATNVIESENDLEVGILNENREIDKIILVVKTVVEVTVQSEGSEEGNGNF